MFSHIRGLQYCRLCLFVDFFPVLFSAKARLIKEGKSEIMALLYVGM